MQCSESRACPLAHLLSLALLNRCLSALWRLIAKNDQFYFPKPVSLTVDLSQIDDWFIIERTKDKKKYEKSRERRLTGQRTKLF